MERPQNPRKDFNLRFLPADTDYPKDRVTSVLVIGFTLDGKILAVRNNRGLDIPGGHVEKTDAGLEATARRETYEEAAVTLSDLKQCTVIESDYLGKEPENLTYMVVMTGLVANILQFTPTDEVSERVFVDPDVFLNEYKAGKRENMAAMVAAAQDLLPKSHKKSNHHKFEP